MCNCKVYDYDIACACETLVVDSLIARGPPINNNQIVGLVHNHHIINILHKDKVTTDRLCRVGVVSVGYCICYRTGG